MPAPTSNAVQTSILRLIVHRSELLENEEESNYTHKIEARALSKLAESACSGTGIVRAYVTVRRRTGLEPI
jgi:hypothetical protein